MPSSSEIAFASSFFVTLCPPPGKDQQPLLPVVGIILQRSSSCKRLTGKALCCSRFLGGTRKECPRRATRLPISLSARRVCHAGRRRPRLRTSQLRQSAVVLRERVRKARPSVNEEKVVSERSPQDELARLM